MEVFIVIKKVLLSFLIILGLGVSFENKFTFLGKALFGLNCLPLISDYKEIINFGSF